MTKPRHATRINQNNTSAIFTHAASLARQAGQNRIALVAAAAICSVITLYSLVGTAPADATQPERPDRISVPLSIELANDADEKPQVTQHATRLAKIDQEDAGFASTQRQNHRIEVKRHTIKPGDNLSSIFQAMGLSAKDVYNITRSGSEGKSLTRMFPGESLSFEFNDETLTKIVREKSPLEAIHFTPDADSFTIEHIVKEPEYQHAHKSAIVTQSLALAASRAGISDTMTMNMANIFGGVIDFVYDVRAGDRFTVVYEDHYLDGEKIDEGNIIAAQYVNRGNIYNAFRYEHDNGEVGYYNEEGESMRKAFLRAPLDFTRVSSGFNLKRLHPITKKVKPHRGIDYAAPTGTPVFSVGEGRVIASGYSNANGKYVFIKHGEAYTTKYLHLSHRNVKKGQRVKQGQIIGKVGCTGLCTGPHLHYEFLVNGVHRNPRTIVKKLPKAKKLPSSELPAFEVATADNRSMLNVLSSQFALAATD